MFSLKPFNTFGLAVSTKAFYRLRRVSELPALLARSDYLQGPVLWLGGGSNLLFTADYPGLVVHICLRGIQVRSMTDQHVIVEVAAGENWHRWVQYSLRQGWYGLENLSLIPGSVGASPIQNIGAYGVEVKSVIDEVICADLHAGGRLISLNNAACQFAYRDSVFKHEKRARYLIVAVRFKLKLYPEPVTHYGQIEATLEEMRVKGPPSALDISRAVMRLRRAKLPDPKKLGNAGSFFKNPIVVNRVADSLSAQYPDLPRYFLGNGYSKLAAAYLIEHAGLKGYRQGDAGVHTQQALVLVNYRDASGQQILQLARQVQEGVQQKYGVVLEIEPVLV